MAHFSMDARGYTLDDAQGSAEELDEALASTVLTEHVRFVVRLAARCGVGAGDVLALHPTMERFHFFDAVTGEAVW
jgi:hypothetical protein